MPFYQAPQMVGNIEVQALLVLKIIEKEAFGDTGPDGDIVGAGPLVVFLGKDLCGGVQDLLLLFRWQVRKNLGHYHPSLY